MTWLAIVLAFCSAAMAALSTSLQHLAATRAPEAAATAGGLFAHLIRNRMWLVGQVFALLGLLCHALALNRGAIMLVQPIIVSGIVFAVPIRSILVRRLPRASEVGAVVIAASGLAAFLMASKPSAGSVDSFGSGSLVAVTASWMVATAMVLVGGRVSTGVPRAFLLGAAAGVYFGLVAVLIKMSLHVRDVDGWIGMLTDWPFWGVLICGVSGVLTNQLAYRSAQLSASMPVLNIVDGLVALAFGYFLFREIPRHSTVAVVVEVIALVAMAIGLWRLARFEAAPLEAAAPKQSGPNDPPSPGPREPQSPVAAR